MRKTRATAKVFLRGALTLLVVSLLSGCASVPNISLTSLASKPPGEVLVFGEVVATNVRADLGASFLSGRGSAPYRMFIRDEATQREEPWWPVKNQKGVYWHLPPGKYVITAYQDHWSGGYGRIWVKFDVPSGYDAVYVGTLKVALGGISAIKIEDDMDAAVAVLKETFPGPSLTTAKSLMRKE